MDHRNHVLSLAGLLVAAGLAAGCGSDSKPAAKTASEPAAKADLESFLMRNGEEPGFRRVEQPQTITGVEELGSAGFTPADARRLRGYGFVATAFQPTEGARNAGVTAVDLFATAQGARRSMAHEVRPSTIRALGNVLSGRFAVEGVPGARGWTGRDQHGNRIGHVLWVQGRCFFILGNEGRGPLAGPLSTGARAIHQRTNGQCP